MDSSGLTPFLIRHQKVNIMKFELTQELLKTNRIYVPNELLTTDSQRVNPRIPAAFIQNLSDLNILIDNATLEALYSLRADAAEAFLESIHNTLKARYGVWGYSVMYPNFPRQVMEADEGELFYNAYAHYLMVYLSDVLEDHSVIWLPRFNKTPRSRLSEKTNYIRFRFIDETELRDVISRDLLNSPVSLSADNLNLLKLLISNDLIYDWKAIPSFKEIRAVLLATGALNYEDYETRLNWEEMTATDVLRFAVGYQAGDVSLATPHYFSTFPRSIRRWIMSLLNDLRDSNMEFVVADMQKYSGMWIGLAEMIHSGEYHLRFPFAYSTLAALRGRRLPKSWAGKVNQALTEGKYSVLFGLLEERPSEFARRLNLLVQRLPVSQHKELVLSFSRVVAFVPTRICYQLQTFFLNLHANQKHRVFFPKGKISKVYYKDNDLKVHNYFDENKKVSPYFSVWNIIQSRIHHSLSVRLWGMSPLGKIWIDPELENIAIPMSQRSASDGLMQLERCSRFELNGAKDVIRFFIHWKEPEGQRTDVDLSVVFFDENLKFVEQISYQNLRSDYCWHSGDITSAPEGATECIDLKISKAIANGAAYAVPAVNLFSGQNFDKLPVAQFGWMTRSAMHDGEIFEPKTVQNCFNLRSPNKMILPAVIDLRSKEVIWMDLGVKSEAWINNVSTQGNKIRILFEYFINKRVVSMADVLKTHGAFRGELVSSRDEADTVFDIDTAKDLINFSTNFLS